MMYSKIVKKAAFLSVWFVSTLGILALASVTYLDISKKQAVTSLGASNQPFVLASTTTDYYQADNKIRVQVGVGDARAEILRQYMEKYDSPLMPYADLLVEVADENGFDFRWMVAIAQQESNLCKKIPDGSHNCWGWGIWCLDYDQVNQKCNEMKVTRFESYEQAIRRIAPQFKDKFLTKGVYSDPEEIMATYTPPSEGSWAFGVNQFLSELE